MKRSTHISNILEQLLEGKTLCANDILASNSNQYFRTIKRHGIELVEVEVANLTNAGQHKERRLHQTIENIERAKKYLKALQGVKHE